MTEETIKYYEHELLVVFTAKLLFLTAAAVATFIFFFLFYFDVVVLSNSYSWIELSERTSERAVCRYITRHSKRRIKQFSRAWIVGVC